MVRDETVPTIVFLPGALLTAGSIRYNTHPVVAIDYAKLCENEPFTIARAVAHVAREIGEIEGPIVLIGHSLGGIIAQVLAGKFPEKIERLILVETTFGAATGVLAKIAVPIVSTIVSITPWGMMRNSIIGAHGRFSPVTKAYLEGVFLRAKTPRQYRAIIGAALSYSGREALADIKCKTLILVGGLNRQTHGQAHYMAKHIENAKMMIVPKAGHMVLLDNGGAVAREIDAFLETKD